MGKFPAALPGELRYCKNHMWCRPGDGRRSCVRLHRLRRPADAGRLLPRLARRPGPASRLKQEIGYIET